MKSFHTKLPRTSGIYIARMKQSNEVVAVIVSYFQWGPLYDGQNPGFYAKSYAGLDESTRYGWPQGKPLDEDFEDWYLAYALPSAGVK